MATSYTLADEMAYLALPDDVRAITDRYVGYRLATELPELDDDALSEAIEDEVRRAVDGAASMLASDAAEAVRDALRTAARKLREGQPV